MFIAISRYSTYSHASRVINLKQSLFYISTRQPVTDFARICLPNDYDTSRISESSPSRSSGRLYDLRSVAGCSGSRVRDTIRRLGDDGRRRGQRLMMETGHDVGVARPKGVGSTELGGRGQRASVQLQQQFQLGSLRRPATSSLRIIVVVVSAVSTTRHHRTLVLDTSSRLSTYTAHAMTAAAGA